MTAPAAPAVYAAIVAVIADLAGDGVGKNRRNEQQGYKFRGIDDVHNALARPLARHGLCMLPRVLSREVVERTTAKGGTMSYVVLEVEFDLVAASDGSRHTIRVVGEAMDSADKATNKAMSAAYKYAAIQAFSIPVDGQPDADETTPEPAPRRADEPAREALRKAWHARLGGLGVKLSEADRHRVQAELFGAESMTDVDPAEAKRRLQAKGLRLGVPSSATQDERNAADEALASAIHAILTGGGA